MPRPNLTPSADSTLSRIRNARAFHHFPNHQPESDSPPSGNDVDKLCSSDMAQLIGAFDWSQTPLGPMAKWPRSLKTMLDVCLHSRFQLAIYWGPNLILLYNDAEREVLGSLHPHGLGRPAREVLRDMWDTVGPMLHKVLERGEATWSVDRPLAVDRYGFLETAYFTWSYSPIPNDVGSIGGVLLVTQETTERVLAERRLRTLREMATETAGAETVEQACATAIRILGRNSADVPFALLYVRQATGSFTLSSSFGLSATPKTEQLPFETLSRGREAIRIDNLARYFDADVAGGLTQTALIIPIGESSLELLAGFLVVGVNDHLRFDTAYRHFFDLVGSQVGRMTASARVREQERTCLNALAELDCAKTAFFSNVSHEFRTPLTLILGTLEEVLSRSTVLGEDRDRIDVAFRNGLRLQKLVNALLDFSRIEAGRTRADYELTDVSARTAELASVFRSTIERAGMRLLVDCQPVPGPVYLDPEMWEKIVLNLLSNAFKYTFAGDIQISVQQVGENIELSIRDTGVGIPQAELLRVFDRFHRVEGVHGRTSEGTGIGLALVQEMVKLHGGSVKVQSTYGQGSTFTVSIPVGKDHLPPDSIASSRAVPGVRTPLHAYVGEALACLPRPASTVKAGASMRPRVLLADDNADMREYISSLLIADYDVTAVVNGQEALSQALQRLPDLILSDVMMPHMDGFELLAALRSREETRTIPVVMLSARADEEAKIEGLEMRADDYLAKPFSSRELRARVASQIELARLRRELIMRSEACVQNLAGRLINAHDEERNRISRELHDDIAQRLALLSGTLEMYAQESRSKAKASISTGKKLSDLHHNIEDIAHSVHELSHGLHSSALRLGLRTALRGLCRTASQKHHINVNFEIDDVHISDQASLSFFRVAQEAFSNAIRHGGAREIFVRLHGEGGLVRMDIRDDGIGFDRVTRTTGLGLISMQERLRMIGGELRITSRLGEGTEISAQLRLPKDLQNSVREPKLLR
jgi:signal transduction histidine kinase